MMNLQFIPLKTSDGQVLGHARVRDGFVTVHTTGTAGAQAFFMTDGGYVTGDANVRLRTGGPVQAVALHNQGELLCSGFARESPYCLDDVRARLLTLFAQKRPEPVQKVPVTADESQPCTVSEATPAAEAAIAADTPQAHPALGAEPACCPQSAHAAPPLTKRARGDKMHPVQKRKSERRIPAEPLVIGGDGSVIDVAQPPLYGPQDIPRFSSGEGKQPATCVSHDEGAQATTCVSHDEGVQGATHFPHDEGAQTAPDVFRTLERLCDESAAAFIPAGGAAIRDEPDSAEDSAMRAESFAALLERCDAVFRKIDAAPNAEALQGQSPSGGWATPDIRGGKRAWPQAAADEGTQDAACFSDGEGVQSALPFDAAPRADPARMHVINPFPHIFPGAQFTRECDHMGTELLIGRWQRNMEHFTITAVRGEYSPRPPERLPGFTRYIRTRQGGFWVRVEE